MFKDLRLLIINHMGKIVLSIVVIASIYVIYTQVIDKTSSTTTSFSELSDVIGSNESRVYNNTVLDASQVLSTIKKYYNKSDVMILLINNKDDYNNAGYRFWVTGRGGQYGQNTNYGNVIISNDYKEITNIVVKEQTINNKYSKKTIDSYSKSEEKNYINLSSKYKSVLLKCNGYTVGIAFLAI